MFFVSFLPKARPLCGSALLNLSAQDAVNEVHIQSCADSVRQKVILPLLVCPKVKRAKRGKIHGNGWSCR